jgi:hypothetical protein
VKTLGSVALGAVAWMALAAPPLAAHPWDSGVIPPTTYSTAVRRVREELTGIEASRRAGDLGDVGQRAQRIVLLADQLPSFALTLPGALRDSVVGEVLRASVELRAAAGALGIAAGGGDSSEVAARFARAAASCALLEEHAPRQYVCPMHCELGKTYDRPGSCPVCGMTLQRITSDRYRVDVAPESAPRAGVPVTLDLRIKDPAGFDATRLQVVHEKRLHLILVSQDLSWFSHEHPESTGIGGFRLRTTFPAGGSYVLFHDFTPDSVGMQVVPVELTVEGAARPPKPLAVDDDKPKRIDGYEISLSHTPLQPTIACALTFTITRGGKPVTDLEPFLGVMGHLILIHRDRTVFVHSHPLEDPPAGSSSIRFNVVFERPGLYKAWGQFQRQGKVLTVPFVVEVTAAPPVRPVEGASSASR